jgi:hypothetical protein
MAHALLDEINSTLDEHFSIHSEAEREQYRSMLATLKDQACLDSVEQCICRFVAAEVDSATPGERGIGRISLSPPRLGGYCRKRIARLPPQDLLELSNLIRNLVFRGYVAYILTCEKFDPTTGRFREDQLFTEWICNIYATNLPKNVEFMLRNVIKTPFDRVKHFLASKNAVGGGFFSVDKTDDILIWYPIAGFMLRNAEMALARKQAH